MTYDKVTLLKQDNKQLWRKAVRLVQLNLRFCILLSLLLITVILFVCLNHSLRYQPKHLSLHQYVRSFLSDPYKVPLKSHRNLSNSTTTSNDDDIIEYNYFNDSEEFDLIWSEETVELFQDQLGIVLDDEPKSLECNHGEFVVSALPGVDDSNIGDNLWQFFSLIALESQIVEYEDEGSRQLSLKAFVTEQMRTILYQLFEGLSLQTLSDLPTICYNLKYAQIIGNKSPIKLKEIAPASSPLLLDPKAKRVKEIAQLFGNSKIRPFFSFNRDVMEEVQQEFLVTKTLQEVEADRGGDINFVGVYITADDKLPIEYYTRSIDFHRKHERTIFMMICDVEILSFCQESFDGKDAKGDARILRKSVDTFDYALMSSCNSTIVSNEFGVLHALINGGDATVYKPEPTNDPDFYVPWLISEEMANFYAIE